MCQATKSISKEIKYKNILCICIPNTHTAMRQCKNKNKIKWGIHNNEKVW